MEIRQMQQGNPKHLPLCKHTQGVRKASELLFIILATTKDAPVSLSSFRTPPRLKFTVILNALTRYNLKCLTLFLKAFLRHQRKFMSSFVSKNI